jgi:hypothetical protein
MTEKSLCAGLVKALRLGLVGSVVFKHADRVTAGIPDVSVTWGGRTTWLEVKFVRAGQRLFDRGVQRQTIARLGRAGSCLYVIYDKRTDETVVLQPEYVGCYDDVEHSDSRPGLDHRYVVEFVRRLHGR